MAGGNDGVQCRLGLLQNVLGADRLLLSQKEWSGLDGWKSGRGRSKKHGQQKQ